MFAYLDSIIRPLRDLPNDPGGQIRLHLLTRMLFSTAPHQWTGEWFKTGPWVRRLCAATPTGQDAGVCEGPC